MHRKVYEEGFSENTCKQRWDSIADELVLLGFATKEHKVVWKGLETRTLSNGQVSVLIGV
ncbi:MAG: hypothetical protein BroJett018_47720 [Chloroflexota bacterium]|nr:MAG: hypothetical protein BroJett018_47720 [Chloroflexota bacterium]